MARRSRPERTTELGKLFAKARQVDGWSVRELEEWSGISNVTISLIEVGRTPDPRFSTVVLLCDALGVDLGDAVCALRVDMRRRRCGPKRRKS